MSASSSAEGWQLDAADLPAAPRTYVQQSFTSYYAIDMEGAQGNDLALRLHPNGLCVVTLAPSHAALVADSTEAAAAGGPAAEPAATDAQQPAAGSTHQEPRAGQQTAAPTAAAPQAAEAQLALSPKLLQAEFRKGRGPLLQSDTILGRLTAGGREYVLRCGVRGLLVELNPRLAGLRGSALLRELRRGYLAVLDVRAAEAAQLASRCLAEEAYEQRRQQRGQRRGEQQQVQAQAQAQQHE